MPNGISANEKVRRNTLYGMHVAFNISRRGLFCELMDKHQCSHKRNTNAWAPPEHSLAADSIAHLVEFARNYLRDINTEPGLWDGIPVLLNDAIDRESWPTHISPDGRWYWAIHYLCRFLQDAHISSLAQNATPEYTGIYEKLVSISGKHLRSLSDNRTKWAEFFSQRVGAPDDKAIDQVIKLITA